MYNEQHLVSFGNFLFDIYGVMVFSNDGKNTPLYKRQVTDADLNNWKTETPEKETWLPSQFKIGDNVVFSVNQIHGENPYPLRAEILAVHFYEGKVKYDLSIPVLDGPPTRVYNIDSCFVFSQALPGGLPI